MINSFCKPYFFFSYLESVKVLKFIIFSSLLFYSYACEDSKSSTNEVVDMMPSPTDAMMMSEIDMSTSGMIAGNEVPDMMITIDAQAGTIEDMAGIMSGEMAGEISAGTEDRMPSCLISCAEFVECTIKQCPGYDEEDDALLMEECLSLCTPAIAELFDRLTGCPEKLRFASTVRTDFLNFCDSESAGFCETYIATCGSWLGQTECEVHYNEAPATGEAYTSGAHQQCYEFHLGSAMRALENEDEAGVREGCERAAGLNTCVDAP